MLLIVYVGHIGFKSLTDGHLGSYLEYFKTLNDARMASVGFINYNASTIRINKEKNFKIKFQVILVFYRTISTGSTQEDQDRKSSRHDLKIVDWGAKHQKQTIKAANNHLKSYMSHQLFPERLNMLKDSTHIKYHFVTSLDVIHAERFIENDF